MKKQTQIPRLGGERGRALGPSDYVSANRIRIRIRIRTDAGASAGAERSLLKR